ncbi:trypsin-5-like [Phymastichus coffea]|uniref:trypsin-5-like n=1 Tax=Phymastichus coffea TaxID=108790 RepID=UPI00273BE546|nr:trypsin-5-like [Phymastichus coffea]
MYRLPLLIALVCGQSQALYGGKEIEIETAAYQVSIHERSHLACGGSILNKDYVLTVASCVDAFVENFKVRAGSKDPNANGSVHEIVQLYRQHDNEPGNDLLLLRVKPSFELDSTRRAIKLVSADYRLKANESLRVTGYGYTDGYVPSSKLRSIDTRSTLLEDCVKRYADRLQDIFPGMMCTDGSDFQSSSCSYDSGNPVTLGDGRLVAVTSSRHSCGNEAQPDVHVLVARAIKWIAIFTSASSL